jgi:signal transduction histidine kinase
VSSALQPAAQRTARSEEGVAAALKRRLPRDAAYIFLFNTAVAALLTLGGSASFWTNFVFSQSIGLALLFLIDGGRLVLWPGRAPPMLPMIGLVAASIPVAVLGGGLLARALLGAPRAGFGGDALWATLAITLASAAFGTYFFWTRERSAHFAAEAAAGRLRGAELERQAAEARFRQLAAQIEPHFLFNTLANLRALIETDPPRAVAMLDHLDGYLRASLAAARTPRVPLADECALLASYLEIVAIRMGARLAWRIDVPATLGRIAVPPMLLQPLVENAVKHGIEPNPAGGEVTVAARREEATLVLEIADTGLGLGGASAGTGFGVASVRERLAATYGDAASLALESRAGGGTLATLRFPMSADT